MLSRCKLLLVVLFCCFKLTVPKTVLLGMHFIVFCFFFNVPLAEIRVPKVKNVSTVIAFPFAHFCPSLHRGDVKMYSDVECGQR